MKETLEFYNTTPIDSLKLIAEIDEEGFKIIDGSFALLLKNRRADPSIVSAFIRGANSNNMALTQILPYIRCFVEDNFDVALAFIEKSINRDNRFEVFNIPFKQTMSPEMVDYIVFKYKSSKKDAVLRSMKRELFTIKHLEYIIENNPESAKCIIPNLPIKNFSDELLYSFLTNNPDCIRRMAISNTLMKRIYNEFITKENFLTNARVYEARMKLFARPSFNNFRDEELFKAIVDTMIWFGQKHGRDYKIFKNVWSSRNTFNSAITVKLWSSLSDDEKTSLVKFGYTDTYFVNAGAIKNEIREIDKKLAGKR